ncbi:angiopoietin-related protein 2-like isoform X2 [Teleopsis dalmanni]|uniref:angiopoietin-related protein 2-like isoform X2 n=1 Tax=Teleopsis dalmanni TaxID=139649 RepID=UPI0018CCE497|nr:angiopoietin-related protein 2-like isoform X2 [Teleopsis dalmanni]
MLIHKLVAFSLINVLVLLNTGCCHKIKCHDIRRDSEIFTLNDELQAIKMDLVDMRLTQEQIIFNLSQSVTEINQKLTVEKSNYRKSCAEALLGDDKESGIYKLYIPESDLKPFYVYCISDPNNGTAWTVIQRRVESSINFFVDWDTYKSGFGNLAGAFFIGLDKLHALTQSEINELWINLEDFEGQKRSAYYDSFAIGDESTKYAINILGKYTGDAGDSFGPHEGQKFSTIDVNNDISTKDCAKLFKSGWWYHDCLDSSNCNLNGEYGTNNTTGIYWGNWHGGEYTLKGTVMAIRPKNTSDINL